MTKEELRALKRDFSHVVLDSVDFDDSKILLAFNPMKSEVDITPVIEKAKSIGITVAFPAEEPGFYETSDGHFINVENITGKTIMLVPGLAFSKDGSRLGRGRGWYDRTIRLCHDNIKTVGVCKKSQLLESIPTESHDMKVSSLIVV